VTTLLLRYLNRPTSTCRIRFLAGRIFPALAFVVTLFTVKDKQQQLNRNRKFLKQPNIHKFPLFKVLQYWFSVHIFI